MWLGYALLNAVVTALVGGVKPRRLVNAVVAVLFASNALLALVLAAREVGPLPRAVNLLEPFANAVSVAAFIVLPFVFPRRRLPRLGERCLFGLAACVAAAYALAILVPGIGAALAPAPAEVILNLPFTVGLVAGTLLLLEAYLGSPGRLQRDQVRFILAAYALKVAVLLPLPPPIPALASLPDAVGAALWLAQWIAFLAVPVGLAASQLRLRRAGGEPRALMQDALVLGILPLGFALRFGGAPGEVEWLLARPLLIGYGLLRYQLLDVDLRERWWLLATAALAGAGAVYVVLLRSLLDAGVDAVVASGVGLVAALGLGLAAARPLARRLLAAPGQEPRAQELYRAALEAAVLDRGEHASSHDRVLHALRQRLRISEREAALAEAEVRAAVGAPGHGPAPGARFLGRYRVEALLGEGGYGRTYLALDEAVGRQVVLKVARASSLEEQRRLLREARILGRMHHPCIVTVFDVEEVAGDVVLVLEYVRGGSLAQRLRRGPFSPREALAMADRVLQALEAAHAEGIVHRDLKPANVLLDERGGAKLADFGVARAPPGTGTASGFSVPGANPGTLRYMSPEQARGLPLDGRSDLYSLGAVLYEALTGHGPLDLEGRAWFDAVQGILNEPPLLPVEGLPEALNRLLEDLLAKEPGDRPPSAADARARLAAARAVLEGA